MATYKNVTGEFSTELIPVGDQASVTSISMANVEGTNACSIDLWVEKKLLGKFYYMKQILLPADTSLVYDLSFDNTANEFGLFIKLTKSASETPAVDVIIT